MIRQPTRVLLACLAFAATEASAQAQQQAQQPQEEASAACPPQAYAMGLRYQQQSAEIEALQRQSFALAEMRLDAALADLPADAGKPAVITDLDETVIDNSDLLVRDMEACHDYTTWDTWKHWEREGDPDLIPGAKEFLDHADSKGVAIFYISDRYDENKEATLATLKGLGLPQVTPESVLLLGPPKAERRAAVEADHTVVLQLGDTLHDFSEAFVSSVPLDQQRDQVETQAERFGRDWIVLPNAAYGTWRKADLTPWDAPRETE